MNSFSTSRQAGEAETWSHQTLGPRPLTQNKKGSHQSGAPLPPTPWDLHCTDEPLKCLAWKTNGTNMQGTQSALGSWDFPFTGLLCGLTLRPIEQTTVWKAPRLYVKKPFANLKESAAEAGDKWNSAQRWRCWQMSFLHSPQTLLTHRWAQIQHPLPPCYDRWRLAVMALSHCLAEAREHQRLQHLPFPGQGRQTQVVMAFSHSQPKASTHIHTRHSPAEFLKPAGGQSQNIFLLSFWSWWNTFQLPS